MCCALLAFLFVCMWHKIVTAQECLAWRPCCSYPHCFKAKSSGPHKPSLTLNFLHKVTMQGFGLSKGPCLPGISKAPGLPI
eukprot:scaffold39665_cov15-Tisochrysis_lutea.AAC.2